MSGRILNLNPAYPIVGLASLHTVKLHQNVYDTTTTEKIKRSEVFIKHFNIQKIDILNEHCVYIQKEI